MRERAGMTVEEVAARAGVDPGWMTELGERHRTRELLYRQWVELVKATQPPRPQWWDGGRRYWARIAAVRAEIEENYPA